MLAVLLASASLGNAGWTSELVLPDGARLAGEIRAENILLPYGRTAYVVGDLLLLAERRVDVEGTLVVLARGAEGPSDGFELQLSAAELIDVPGAILGGAGRSLPQDDAHRGESGGIGSSILLEAPLVMIDGRVEAGAGGRSGPDAKGATGGEAVVRGIFCTRRLDDASTLIGGAGGHGGDSFLLRRGTDGGDGGDAFVMEDSLAFLAWSPRFEEGARTLASLMAQQSGQQSGPCQHGTAGARGGNASGGTGSPGSNGEDGTSSSPLGTPGGNGGSGGNASGASGSGGGAGGTCCGATKGVGGGGGDGGNGGRGDGGDGGPGGNGGNGYVGSEGSGAGGIGGNGGVGGSGHGGNGGKGGKGGSGCPGGDGGLAGAAGAGAGGDGGVAGSGGAGSPPGTGGTPGSSGAGTSGTGGECGSAGGECSGGCS